MDPPPASEIAPEHTPAPSPNGVTGYLVTLPTFLCHACETRVADTLRAPCNLARLVCVALAPFTPVSRRRRRELSLEGAIERGLGFVTDFQRDVLHAAAAGAQGL